MQRNYSTRNTVKAIIAALLAMAIAIGCWIGGFASDDGMITCWAMCKPGSHVDVHIKPDKHSEVIGRLDPCDPFKTDAESRNGYIWCDIGENLGGWIYCGYVSTEKPEPVFERYVCVAKKQVACRRWIQGPRIDGRIGWLHNMSTVEVFYRTDEWSVTSRGYIKSEWLEVDPE